MMNDYDMNVHYHTGKANVVADGLSRMSMGSTTDAQNEKYELVKDVHRLARLGVRQVDSTNGDVSVNPSSESSLVVEVKQGQHLDFVLKELKDSVLMKMNETFALGRDRILRYQDGLSVTDADDFRTKIVEEDHGSRYSIHLGSTKMHHDLKNIYWWDGMKHNIAEYVGKCPNCHQVMAEHLKTDGLTQIIEVPTWKWEAINMDFVVCLPTTRRQPNSIWVTMDILTKSAHIIPVKSTE